LDNLVRQDLEGKLSPQLIGFAENDVRVRPFKLLRTQLSKQLKESGDQIIGVTSPSPHAGKSFIAANLAASMSRLAQNNVVLIDLDLQRASVAELFGIEGRPGVTEYLLGQEIGLLADIARPYGETNLTVVPTSLRDINSAELLATDRFTQLMSELRALPERPTILCDLPPLFVSDDAIIIAQQLDAVIVVVEQGVTTKKQLTASLELLYPTRILGTVFNRFHNGLLENYGSYKGYQGYY
jgi:protein-tyrosine kinase